MDGIEKIKKYFENKRKKIIIRLVQQMRWFSTHDSLDWTVHRGVSSWTEFNETYTQLKTTLCDTAYAYCWTARANTRTPSTRLGSLKRVVVITYTAIVARIRMRVVGRFSIRLCLTGAMSLSFASVPLVCCYIQMKHSRMDSACISLQIESKRHWAESEFRCATMPRGAYIFFFVKNICWICICFRGRDSGSCRWYHACTRAREIKR